MAFFEERFPDEIAQGAIGGPRWKTSKARLPNGRRQVNRDWDAPLHRYQVSQAIKSAADFELVRAFFFVVYGAYDGFRFKDFADYRATQTDGVLTLVSGADWQLGKSYAFGARSFTRAVSKPVAGSVKVYRTRASATTDITATSTIATDTGIVTIAGHLEGDSYAWAGEFDVPVAFEDDAMEAQLIGSAGNLFVSWPSIWLEEVPV